jgi:hypothetical protein
MLTFQTDRLPLSSQLTSLVLKIVAVKIYSSEALVPTYRTTILYQKAEEVNLESLSATSWLLFTEVKMYILLKEMLASRNTTTGISYGGRVMKNL